MRSIKFRAWHKKNKKMFIVQSIDWSINNPVVVKRVSFDSRRVPKWARYSSYHPKSLELMQYTGLKDKHGKEIYEGDVVSRDVGCFFRQDYEGIDGWDVWTLMSKEILIVKFGLYDNGEHYSDYDGGYGWYFHTNHVDHQHKGEIKKSRIGDSGGQLPTPLHHSVHFTNPLYGIHEDTDFKDIEIIGNIYENPELLEDK